MSGDLSRDTFQPHQRFSRVLMQQGRVMLDADWNEQTSILLHHLRTLAADLIGPHGGPGDGFRVVCDEDLKCDFVIAWGHYYVDGILCENVPARACRPDTFPEPVTYASQPDYPLTEEDDAILQTGTSYLVYLDVWERHLTHLQVPDIREVALGGADTAARARVVWQVRAAERPKEAPEEASCDDLLRAAIGTGSQPCLRARARVSEPSDDPCIIPPEARYRGPENQLYRVEIHDGGAATGGKGGATFKWSENNGSDCFAIRRLQGTTTTVDTLGYDAHRTLKEGTWVEIVDDHSTLRFAPRPLRRVDVIDRADFTVTLAVPDGQELPVFDETSTAHPLLRRWDQPSDVIPVQEGTWLDLEDGVQIRFEPGGTYRTGDHWLIPARTATRDVLWPVEYDADGSPRPQALPPDGIAHHYAPLAQISVSGEGVVSCDHECRFSFDPLCGGSTAPTRDIVLTPVPFDVDSTELGDDARSVIADNVARIERALRATEATVEVRGLADDGEGNASALAAERADIVRDAYGDAGVPRNRMRVTSQVAGDDVHPRQRRRVDTIIRVRRDRRGATEHPTIDIDGVGPTFAERLENAGITDAADVANLKPDELAELLSPPGSRPVSAERAAAIIAAAHKLVSDR